MSNEHILNEETKLISLNGLTVYHDRLMDDIKNAVKNIVDVSYSDLKSLKDFKKLTPGLSYKITDYECTTTQEATQTIDHRFDIIVTAIDETTLSEEALAAHHKGDTYFSNSKLQAWKLWYCFDNDTTRFTWASPNGKGVIYRMIDEMGNDCPYDFKNMMFGWRTLCMPEIEVEYIDDIDNPIKEHCKSKLVAIEYTTASGTGEYIFTYAFTQKKSGNNWIKYTGDSFCVIRDASDATFPVFKVGETLNDDTYSRNVTFLSGDLGLSDELYTWWQDEESHGDAIYHYTFNVYDGISSTPSQDYTILCPNYCYDNIITPREGYDGKTTKRYLPYVQFNNTGKKQACYTNTVDAPIIFENINNQLVPCYISFGKGAHNNHLGKGCKNIGAREDFYNNEFALGCNNIYVTDKVQNNKFGIYCQRIQMDDSCVYNEFKNQVGTGLDYANIIFDKNCQYNIVGSNTRGLTLEYGCSRNIFEDSNHFITLQTGSDNQGSDYNVFEPSFCGTSETNRKIISSDNKHYFRKAGSDIVEYIDDKFSTVDSKYSQLPDEIEDCKNLIYAAEQHIDEIDAKIDIASNKLVEITYSELKDLRDNGNLIPGAFYRITDYQCYTSQENTRSANHPFDIIVLAIDNHTLSEDASAVMRDGDTYYKHANITTWKLKYTLDDPEHKYSWGFIVDKEQIPIINNFLYDSSNCSIKPELITDNTFNEPVPIKYILTIDAENNEFYDSTRIENDLFIEWGYEQEPRMDDTSLCIYKTDVAGLGDEPDPEFAYADTYDKFFYRGKEEVDGVIYDKWQKFETNNGLNEPIRDGYNSQMYFILTPEIVNGELQITELPTFEIKSEILIRVDEEHTDNNYNGQFTFFAGAKRLDNDYEQHLVIYPNVQWNDDDGNGESITNYASLLDYENPFFYCGQEEVDGKVYDKWRKINTDLMWEHDWQIYALTPVIVKDGEISMDLVQAVMDTYTNSYSGVIYQMIDDRGNECPYDFKNIQYSLDGQWYFTFDNDGVDATIQEYNVENFDDDIFRCGNNIIKSLNNDHQLYGFGVWSLNRIVFKNAQYSYSNTFDINCSDNSFGYDCHNNSFESECSRNSFGEYCSNNSFGEYCSNNSFGNSCSNNSFGIECFRNTFGSHCSRNSFGSHCGINTFGQECYENSFGNNCNDNSFENECCNNTFGNGCCENTFTYACSNNSFETNCYDNSFGGECCNNTFGNGCVDNSFGNNCSNNSFGNSCDGNSFESDCSENSFINNCYNNTFGTNCYYNTFGNRCQENSFGTNCYYNSFGNDCYENSFGSDCYENSFINNCYNNTFGDKCCANAIGSYFSDNYFGLDCCENSFESDCCENSFINNCYNNTFGNGCQCNSFGNGCQCNSFGNGCQCNSFGNACINNSFGSNCNDNAINFDCCYNVKFDDACSHNILQSDIIPTVDNKIQNFHIIRGVNGTVDEYNYIDIQTLGAEYEIKIAKNSKGDIKFYCEADLIA